VNEPEEMLNSESSIEDEEMIWKQFVELELDKIQHEASNKSWNQTVAPEALQFAFRHAASYLIARLNKARGQEVPEEKPLTISIPDRPLHSPDSLTEVEKAGSPDTLTPPASETDSSTVPVPSIAIEAAEILNTENFSKDEAAEILNTESFSEDEEELWRQFIQDELSKIQPREADKSLLSKIAPEVFQFAFRHLASYMIARLKKARESEGSEVSDTETHPSRKKKRRKKGVALNRRLKRERRRKSGSKKSIVKSVKKKAMKHTKIKPKRQKSSAAKVFIMKPAKKIA
jgi:hypothetical protein